MSVDEHVTTRSPSRTGSPAGLVSVMMPAFNAERFIGEALASLIRQTYRDWELIVVDDGSTDRTGALASAVGDPRVRTIRQDNRGEAASRNVALDASSGEYLAFLDADDAYLPEHLARAVDHLERHPEHGGVYSDGYYIDARGGRLARLSSRRHPPIVGRAFERVVLRSDVIGPPICVVVRRGPVERHHLRFDESLRLGTDWDFFMRFSDVADVGYTDEPTCLYRLHGANVTVTSATQLRRRAEAACRANAIRWPSFAGCPVDTRAAVFYALLIDALEGEPERQEEAIAWPQFEALPGRQQARLLRLMASRTFAIDGDRVAARRWLRRSAALDPLDVRAWLLRVLDGVSPGLCSALIRVRTARQRRRASAPPYEGLDFGQHA